MLQFMYTKLYPTGADLGRVFWGANLDFVKVKLLRPVRGSAKQAEAFRPNGSLSG